MNVTPVKFMTNTLKVTEMLFFRLKTWYWNLLVVLVIVAGVRMICEVEEFLVLFMCQKKYMTIAGMIALIVG